MLVKAGADILMPVMVDGEVGTAMDYAYYSFHQVKLRVENASSAVLACVVTFTSKGFLRIFLSS